MLPCLLTFTACVPTDGIVVAGAAQLAEDRRSIASLESWSARASAAVSRSSPFTVRAGACRAARASAAVILRPSSSLELRRVAAAGEVVDGAP